MPPVATITVVFPALMASRTSIHVISSIQIVFGAGSGFGASAQLYGLSRQSPPPRERGSGGRCWPAGACAYDSAVIKVRAAPITTVLVIGAFYGCAGPSRVLSAQDRVSKSSIMLYLTDLNRVTYKYHSQIWSNCSIKSQC